MTFLAQGSGRASERRRPSGLPSFSGIPLSPHDLISRIKSPGDFKAVEADYDLMSWDDRFIVCEHIADLLNKESERLGRLI